MHSFHVMTIDNFFVSHILAYVFLIFQKLSTRNNILYDYPLQGTAVSIMAGAQLKTLVEFSVSLLHEKTKVTQL